MSAAARARVEVVRVTDLISWARSGRLRFSEFDRPFRWDTADVVTLFDSVLRGLPIGSVVVARHAAVAGRVRFGPLQVEVGDEPEAYLVVDGSRRLTALVGVLAAPPDVADPRFQISYDLTGGALGAGRPPPHSFPLRLAFDVPALTEWRRTQVHLPDSEIERVDGLVERLRDYRIPITVVTAGGRVQQEIFVALNTRGTRLSGEDLARVRGSAADAAPPSDLHGLGAAVSTFGFGLLDEQVLRDSVSAIRGDDRELTEAASVRTLLRAERALLQAVVFLREDAGVPHARLVPDDTVLPLLTRFTDLFGRPVDRAAELLRRWVWRGATGGGLPRSARPGDRAAAVVHDDPVASALRALALVPPAGPWSPDLGDTDLDGSAAARIVLLGMLSRGPRVLVDSDDHAVGERTDVVAAVDDGRWPVVEVVPGPEVDDGPLGPGWANLLVHPVITGPARPLLLGADLPPDVLASHLVDTESVRLLRAGDTEGFLRRRAAAVDVVVRTVVQRRARWGFRDDDPAALLDDGEPDIDRPGVGAIRG